MNLLVTGAFAWDDKEIEYLKSLGHNVVFMQQESELLPCDYGWVEGVIGNGIFMHHSIEKFVSLRYIQLTSAGFDRVPIDYINEHNIKLFNARGVYSIPMAEFVVCGVLDLYKQSKYFTQNKNDKKFIKHRGLLELFGKTVCVIGCGSVGNECAKRFSAFGCKIIGVDSAPYSSDLYSEILPIENINDALSVSDIVLLTLPLTNETYHLMNKEKFGCMRMGSVLVNIARGGIVDTDALIEALNNKLGGAVLDVFEQEPLDTDSPLWTIENVIITPHNSFVGDGNHERMLKLIFSNLRGQR